MITNPNPDRITDASWRYIESRVVLDAGDVIYAGSYVNKPGYHGTRAENQARDKIDGSTDYSVRLPRDLRGPGDKTAAYDFKYLSAARGDYRDMARRGSAVLAAFEARDPRLFGWREWLGQTDPDRAAEGLDFVTWTKRVPDGTHEWHDHEAELREFVESWDNKACMLSVVSGETLPQYLARGGRLLPGAPVPPDLITEEDELKLWIAPADREGHEGMFWVGCAGYKHLVSAGYLETMKYVDTSIGEGLDPAPRAFLYSSHSRKPAVRGNCDGMGPQLGVATTDAGALAKELGALGVGGATPAQVEQAMRNVMLRGAAPETPR